MKQIDKIARDIKATFAGTYNNYYKTCGIYLDTKYNELFTLNFCTGVCFYAQKHQILLAEYVANYGNWSKTYGTVNKWTLTKKQIAKDIESNCREYDIEIPKWLQDEIDYYLSK